ncbi:probable peroxygenase 5 [Neltuma alba]|uniref:probable peroxygenase 5 n=1 Tax=Neltuma alba TaxID=207710 RepID=UPI0010A553ED|nr:probable peroxygenase 5 [Prosopis alba]
MASSSSLLTPQEGVGGEEQSVLQKHVSFFDRNKDGVIYPSETFQGFRAIGSGVFVSIASAAFIHFSLSFKTRPGKFPSPLLPIEVENIKLGKHGSDSGVYDQEGRFVASKFEEIFSKHAHTYPDALTANELKEMLKENRAPRDYQGWVASEAEWKILYKFGKDRDGLLEKDTVRAVYDGTLFHLLEKQHSAHKRSEN